MRAVMVYLVFLLAASRAHALVGRNLLGDGNVDVGGSRAVVAVFLSSECPCSRSHLDVVRKLAADYPEYKFVAVHSNRDEKDAAKFFADARLPFPVVDDRELKLADRFEASRTPHAFVLDPDEKVLYRGGVSDSLDGARAKKFPLREALADLKAGRKIKRFETRALGCAISRSSK